MKKIQYLAAKTGMVMTGIAATVTTAMAQGASPNFDTVTAPIINLIKALVNPALGIVGALGALFSVVLGVKYAKAEEPQEREKAKSHLKNAIIGFVLIFVLILGLKLLMPIMQQWAGLQVVNVATGT